MTQFSLADNVFANAKVDTSEKRVCIWLGVRYSFISIKENNQYRIGKRDGRVQLRGGRTTAASKFKERAGKIGTLLLK